MEAIIEYGPVPIPAGPEAPATARSLLNTLEGAVGSRRDVAELLLSELATNVVMHTDCAALAVTVCVSPDRVRFGVSDCEPHHLPERREPGVEGPGGFGLQLVEQLAAAWGTAIDPFGKAVWFELERPADTPGGRPAYLIP